MKQLVILSGKGGTGKTSVAASFAHLARNGEAAVTAVLADADVDAANLELVLGPEVLEQHEFRGGQIPVIDYDVCSGCGECMNVCRFDAILEQDDGFRVDPIACEGCGACHFACPSEAIAMELQEAGAWFQSESRYGPLYHAELYPGEENSGKLVTLIKQHARLAALDGDFDLVIIDGPPGIGCPVISAVSGADLTLIVTEPTIAGMHDMKRILDTTRHFGVPALMLINKSDLYEPGTQEIIATCRTEQVPIVGMVPYDLSVTEAMTQGEPVTSYLPDSPASQALRRAWAETRTAVLEAGS